MKSTQVTVQMERGLYLGNMKFKMGVEEQWGLLLAVRRPELGEFSFIIINKEVFFFFWPYPAACGILVPWPGIELMSSALEVQSLNHWTTREVPELCVCVCAKSLQLCPTLCDPMDCSLPGSSVHGILQTRILEWVAMSSYPELGEF